MYVSLYIYKALIFVFVNPHITPTRIRPGNRGMIVMSQLASHIICPANQVIRHVEV